jgi:hypothetical protein
VFRFVLLSLVAAFAWGADTGTAVVFSKSFPGSLPAYYSVTVEQSGAAVYNESTDEDNAEKISIEPKIAAQIFDLAAKLDHFKKPLESGMKVANMGEKTLRWQDPTGKTEAKFNYSLNEDARALTDLFERIAESTRLMVELSRVMKHDRLGVDQTTSRIKTAWDSKRLVGTTSMLPLLDKVANNEAFLHMARERAAQVADSIRATAP